MEVPLQAVTSWQEKPRLYPNGQYPFLSVPDIWEVSLTHLEVSQPIETKQRAETCLEDVVKGKEMQNMLFNKAS